MTLLTGLSIEECKARLASDVDAERGAFSWSGYAGTKPILGVIRDTDFRLQKRHFYRASFAPYFFGRFVASDGGTRIEGKFQVDQLVKVLTILWFAGLAVFIVALLVAPGRSKSQTFAYLGIFLGMAALGAAQLRLFVWLGRRDQPAIVEFLKSTLEATDVGSVS